MSNENEKNGFTLLEIIAIFVIGAILAVMTMPYFYSGALKSSTPIERLKDSSYLNQAMEAVVAYHDLNYASPSSSSLTTFASNITSFLSNNSLCQDCSVTTTTVTVGGLTNALLVTITSSSGEKIYHLFTVQN